MQDLINQAVIYIKNNPTLSFHHVAIKFGVDTQKLLEAYGQSRQKVML
jgi:hypothetical protein